MIQVASNLSAYMREDDEQNEPQWGHQPMGTALLMNDP